MSTQVETTRPEYDEYAPDWRLMRDAVSGERAIKAGGTLYLPMPSGFANQQDGGTAMYQAYQARAQFPEIVAPAIKAMTGVIHSTQIQIDLPAQMEYLWENATSCKQPLEEFHRRVTAEILTTGRYGVLAEAPPEGGDPYLAGYAAEAIINWSDCGSFFVLNESGLERNGFEWAEHPRYRVLEVVDGRYTLKVYEGDSLAEETEAHPSARGRQQIDFVPLVIAGPTTVSTVPEPPPMIGVARPAVAIYQLSADYRWQLFMSGQETLFVFNADTPDAVGAGVVVGLKSESDAIAADARYVGPTGSGIAAHRTAMQDAKEEAAMAGAKLFASGSNAAESGDALKIRFAAETASIVTVALASCAAMEKSLRNVGRMLALSDEALSQIVVHPPKSFAEADLTPQEVMALMGLTDKGLLSLETAYERLQAGNWANPERDWAEESGMIDLPSDLDI